MMEMDEREERMRRMRMAFWIAWFAITNRFRKTYVANECGHRTKREGSTVSFGERYVIAMPWPRTAILTGAWIALGAWRSGVVGVGARSTSARWSPRILPRMGCQDTRGTMKMLVMIVASRWLVAKGLIALTQAVIIAVGGILPGG